MSESVQGNKNLLEGITHTTNNRPFSIHHTSVPASSPCALYLHWHTEFELFYVEHGTLLFHIGNQNFTLQSGDALLIPPFLLHSAENLTNDTCSHFAFVFSPDYLTNSVPDSHYFAYLHMIWNQKHTTIIPITGKQGWRKQFLLHLEEIFSCYEKSIEHNELKIHGHFLLLWQELTTHSGHSLPDYSYQKLSSQLEPVFPYIHAHFSEEICLEQLADSVYLSREQFCRSFKKLTGVSAFYYLNRYRIQKSCEYLSQTQKKIAEIASLCGYNNISYFNREFKRHVHMPPLEYRTQLQLGQATLFFHDSKR